jgi:hypothetical protein
MLPWISDIQYHCVDRNLAKTSLIKRRYQI